jgi:hypothetical protein
LAGVQLNTRGLPVGSTAPEVLHAKSSGSMKKIGLKVPDNALSRWDNYSVQVKFKMKKGRATLRWRVDGNTGLFVRLTEERGIRVGAFDGNTYAAATANGWPNPVPIPLAKDEWYLLECLSVMKEDEPGKTFLRVILDRQTIWTGLVDLVQENHCGPVQLQVNGDAEYLFDDLLVQRIDRRGNVVGPLFIDTFDGSKQDQWEGLDAPNAPEPYLTLRADSNPAFNLECIENLLFVVNYKYTKRA